MALTPILNSGWYKIKNLAYGAIRDDEGALGAKGNSKDEELEVSHGLYSSPQRTWSDTVMNCSGTSPGTRIPRTLSPRYHLVLRPTLEALLVKSRRGSISASRTLLRPAPGLFSPSSRAPILRFYMCTSHTLLRCYNSLRLTPPNSIYQLPSAQCPDLGHWELNNGDKKEPVSFHAPRHSDEHELMGYTGQAQQGPNRRGEQASSKPLLA
jgi:hypothetical protein